MTVLHIWHFTEPHGNKKHNVLLSQTVLFMFFLLPHSLFSFCQSLYNLPCSSPSLLHSLSPCVSLHHLCVSFSLCLSFSFILSPSPPRGHWGQAWCSRLVDKYHVRLFHVFSGRVTVYLLPALFHGAALLSAVLQVYLHF